MSQSPPERTPVVLNGSQHPPPSASAQPPPLLSVAQQAVHSLPQHILQADPATFAKGGIPLSENDYAYSSADTSTAGDAKFPRISRPVPMMRVEYDVVVVGSGYGGAVAASRMARAGKSVCVLELGRERWPGEYPVGLAEATPEVHVSGNIGKDGEPVVDATTGDPTGLYHLVLGEGQNAFVANGLGGTSLLNANIFLPADERTLQLPAWPHEISASPASLDKYYTRAASVLQPVPYPNDSPPLKKLSVLEKQAELMGQKEQFYRPPQTTSFTNGLNSSGIEMRASTLSGQDCTGVNDGSKGSVLMNYLPDAWNWGAELFCECEVRYVKRDPSNNSWLILFAWHGDKRAKFENFYKELMWVKAREFVFLGAGTLGTTEILLRSRDHGLKISSEIGRGMSGNGDILSFGYNTDFEVNSIGREDPGNHPPVGPTITGVIDMRDTMPDVLDGYVLEEGAAPEALAKLLQGLLELMPGKVYPENYGLTEKLRHLFSRAEAKLLGPYSPGGSVNRTQIYLIMSHDSNEATLTLENGKPYLRFLGVGRSAHVKELNEMLARATSKIGGTLINSPFYALLGEEEITVHPIGGANMSSDGTGRNGATNHFGEVFTGTGEDVHPGLVVVDGSAIPCALGVNPFATITALAERSVEGVAAKRQIRIDYAAQNSRLDLFGPPMRSFPLTRDMARAQHAISSAAGKSGIRFTEVMEGYLYIGDDIEDFQVAADAARGSSTSARFLLSVDSYSTQNLIERSDHAALATGTFACGALSRDPFMVLRGEVQFFSLDTDVADGKNLAYKFDLVSSDGKLLHFNGYKVIDSKIAFSTSKTWKATTTLYVTLTRMDKTVVARGVLTIPWRNFVSELASFGQTGSTISGRIGATVDFLGYFASQTAGYFFSPLRALQYPTLTTNGYYQKQPPTEIVTLTAQDGIQTFMHVYTPDFTSSPRQNNQNGVNGQLPPILMIPGAAVDHQIFALPTIPTNAVDYFLARGYTIYIPTHRVGRTPLARSTQTTFSARLDIKAALEHIRRETPSQVYVIAHCAGSIALGSGLLDGTIPASWLKGLTASQVFISPHFAKTNMLKARLPLPLPKVYSKVVGEYFDCATSPTDSLPQRLMNQVLRFYPVGSTTEICNSAVCHRSELVFGRLWSHSGLNEATHANLGNFLGGTNMHSLMHLMRMGSSGYVMDNEFASLITGVGLKRLEGLKVLFVQGGKNAVYEPENTLTSYELLREEFGSAGVGRVVFEDRGHLDCWMGKSAYMDVYPAVANHIDEVMSGGVTGEVTGKG